MKSSILTKFFIGYFSFAVLGFVLISSWSTNMIYNHLLGENVDKLYKYATIASDNISSAASTSITDIEDPDKFFSDFNNVLSCDLFVLDTENALVYTTDKTTQLNNDSSNIIIKDFNPADYQKKHYKVNRFYNIYKTDTLSVIHSIKKGGNVLGYVIAHMPTSTIKKSSYNVTFIFYVTYGIILELSLIVFFSFLWFIYIPLKQIRLAAM